MKILEKLFGSKPEETTELTKEVEHEEVSVPVMYDYGLGALRFLLMSRDYGWNAIDEEHKKVILTNPKDCENKITLMGMMSAWRGTGHTEWEALLAGWFIQAVIDAIDKDEGEADITHLFDRDLIAADNRIFTKEQVKNHLLKWFDIVEETDSALRLRIRIGN